MTIDYSSEYRFWSNTETVTITLPGGAAQSNITAKREEIDSRRQFFNGIALSGNEMLWNVPVVLVTGELTEGTTITDSGSVVWRVNSVVKLGVGNSYIKYQCLCVKHL